MAPPDVDDLDFDILHLLQEDARGTTPVDMAERQPVSDQTIRNRIANLEDGGIIEGYVPIINYRRAGFPIKIRFSCTAPLADRASIAEDVLEIENVVRVEETLRSRGNVRPMVVTEDPDEITEIASELAALGLEIESQYLVDTVHRRPFGRLNDRTPESP